MTTKERIKAIRLSERLQDKSEYGKKLGVCVKMVRKRDAGKGE